MTGPVRVTLRRTVGRLRSLFSTAFAAGAFLSAVAVLFSFRLEAAEGGTLSVLEVWATCLSPVLPVFVSILGMDVWSEERRSGRLEVLLATAVLERDLVLGKFLGLWMLSLLAVLLSFAQTVAVLWFLAPATLSGVSVSGSFPAVFGLAVQAFLWCAVVSAMSAAFAHAAAAACAAVLLTVGIPRVVWFGLMSWAREGRTAFGTFPFDAHALDMATGVVSAGTVFGYLFSTGIALYVATKCVAFARMTGRGAGVLRLSTVFAIALALVAAGLSVSLAARVDFVLDIPISGVSASLSPRTRGVLGETSGHITATCLLSRKDPRFRAVDRLLRLFLRESEAVGGARFTLQYVDPHWDIGAAERLESKGVNEESLVFESGRRIVSVPLKGGFDERVCAAAIRRLSAVPSRRNVYWTVGHGESAFDSYGAFGMSDIARDLSRGGYLNQRLDLATAAQIPGDCALIVVAGARNAFSREELGRLEAYLKEGGRLLVLVNRNPDEGVTSILSSWGIRPLAFESSDSPTISGSDVIASDFADHPITLSLKGSRVVLEHPVSFAPSVAAEAHSAADMIGYQPLASSGKNALAVVVERGAGAGKDLAIRPTRIVAIGDMTFATNASLASRGNANRDFFLNCAAYLSGAAIVGASGDSAGLLVSGLDREGRFRLTVISAGAVPLLVFLVLAAEVVRRRRKS